MSKAGHQKQTQYEKIYRDMRTLIFSGRWAPESQIPTEGQLAEKYGVSILTVRQAQQILVDENLIEKRQGRGSFVVEEERIPRKILLVCGLSMKDANEISPYHIQSIRYAHRIAHERQIDLHMIWMDHEDRAGFEFFRTNYLSADYCGFLLLGCWLEHPVMEQLAQGDYNYAAIGRSSVHDHSVCLALEQAMDLSLAQFPPRPPKNKHYHVLTIEGTEDLVRQRLGQPGMPWEIHSFSMLKPRVNIQWDAYHEVKKILQADVSAGFLFMDSVLSSGGTMAIMEHGKVASADWPQVVIICGDKEIAPLGLPASYIIHDTRSGVEQAIDMVLLQMQGDPAGQDARHCPYRLYVPETA